MYRVPMEYNLERDGAQGAYRMAQTPQAWHRVSAIPGAPPLSRTSPNQGPSPGQQMFQYAHGTISRSTSFDRKDGARYFACFFKSLSAFNGTLSNFIKQVVPVHQVVVSSVKDAFKCSPLMHPFPPLWLLCSQRGDFPINQIFD